MPHRLSIDSTEITQIAQAEVRLDVDHEGTGPFGRISSPPLALCT
jgi:hypothetical protein